MRRGRVEFEGVLEIERRDRSPLGAKPSFGDERPPVQPAERGADVPVGDADPRCQC